jgi:hypothetical protein
MKTVFEKLPDRLLTNLVFDFQKSGLLQRTFSRQPFSFSKNYSAEKWRKWFSNLEKSEMIIVLIFKSKQKLFSFAE